MKYEYIKSSKHEYQQIATSIFTPRNRLSHVNANLDMGAHSPLSQCFTTNTSSVWIQYLRR